MGNLKDGSFNPTTDDGTVSVKEGLKRKGRKSRQAKIIQAKSPIPEQIKDKDEYREFFKTYKDVFIPYAGTDRHTSNGLLGFLLSLPDLSPTKNSVIESKAFYSLSGKIKISKKIDPEFMVEREDQQPGADEAQIFIDFLKELDLRGVDGQPISIRDWANIRLSHIETCGNFYYLVSKSVLAGSRAIQFRIIPPDECLYLATKDEEGQVIAVSKYWTEDYITRNPPKMYAVYPESLTDESGVERCMVHEKTRSGDTRWYGRPRDMGSLSYQFLEYQNADYLNKETEGGFTGKVFIEVEEAETGSIISDEDSQQDGYDSMADQLELSFTNKSEDPMSIFFTTRPSGARGAVVDQFAANTSENWYKIINEEAERQILKTHNWPKKLLGLTEATGLSTNEFLDIFKIVSATTIKAIQEDSYFGFNEIIIPMALEFMEVAVGDDLTIEFTSPFYEMLKDEADTQEDGVID